MGEEESGGEGGGWSERTREESGAEEGKCVGGSDIRTNG